jgi:tetratricopeptide (TPR) repeat protein
MGKKKKEFVARTFDEYKNIIKDITQKNRDNYIFRGQRDIKWDIECGLSRQLKNNLSIDNNIDLKKAMFHYQREMLLRIKRKKYMEYKDLSDIDILAHQQHIGAATIMIDFTKSHLVALYFACLSIRVEQDGVVFLTDKSDERYRDYDDYRDRLELKEIGSIWSPGTCIYLYYPGQLIGRTDKQESVLVFNTPVIPKKHFKQIRIWGGGKDKMLEELSSLEINEEKLFNDPYGFARANSCNSAINIELLPEEQQSNVQKYNVDKLEKKEENKDYIFYMAIATMNYEIGAYKDAISNLNKALKLKPDYAEAYNNRGIAKGNMGEYKEAIADYDKALKLKPDYAEVYVNRCVYYCKLGQKEKAEKDIKKARVLAEQQNNTQAISTIEKVEKLIQDTGCKENNN